MQGPCKREIITYDEALTRAGGFGYYQMIVYVTATFLALHGNQIIYNFVFLSSEHKQQCLVDGQWEPCDAE
jgi:hypothetical protein